MFKVLILVVITSLFFQLKGVSQLHIVKDNIACTYGLKNAANEWVVKPSYLLIEQLYTNEYRITDTYGKGIMNNEGLVIIPPEYSSVDVMNGRYYWVTKPNGRGIITKEGLVVVPPKFEAIYLLSDRFFMAQQKDEKWVYTDQGKLLFEKGYEHIEKDAFKDEFVLTRKEKDTFYSSIVSSTGSIVLPEIQGCFKPFNNSSRVFIGDKRDYNNDCIQNVGVIDRSGNIVIPRTMEQLGNTCKGYIFTQDQKIGLMDLNFNVLLEPKYWIFETNTYERRGLPHLACDKLYRIFDVETKKYGFMKGDGTMVLKPNYNQIEMIQYYLVRSNRYHYIIQQDSKYGLLSETGEISLPAIYDTLLIKALSKNSSDYNHSTKTIIIAKKLGKYGVINDSAQIVVPFQYEHYLQTNGYECLIKGTQISAIVLNNEMVKKIDFELVKNYQNIRLYKLNGKFMVFLLKKGTTNTLELKNHEYNQCVQYGQKLVINLLDYAYIVDLSDLAKPWKKVYAARVESGIYPIVYTYKGKQGLMHPNTGKLLLDTIYAEINSTYYAQNRLWAMVSNTNSKGESTSFYHLFDTLGVKRTSIKFDVFFLTSDTSIVMVNGKKGIIDAQFNWVLPPKFAYIQKVFSNVYAVYTPSQKFGLFKTNKTWLADTVYTQFERINGLQNAVFDYYHTNPYYKNLMDTLTCYWQLSNSKSTILVNNFGEKLSSADPNFNNKRRALSIERSNAADNAFKIEINDSLRSIFQSRPYFEAALDTAFALFYAEKKVLLEAYMNTEASSTSYWISNPVVSGASPTKEKPALRIPFEFLTHYFKSRSVVSCNNASFTLLTTQIVQNHNGWDDMGMANYVYEYTNFIYKNNQLESVTLLSIFNGNQSLLESQLMKAIQKRDDLVLDCSSLENMVNAIGQNFYLTHKGLWLILANHNPWTGQKVEVLIPFDELKNNTDTEWICAYL